MAKFYLIVSCLVFACLIVKIGEAKPVEIIDSGNADIKEITAVVCQVTRGVHRQISRLSTIDKLINYLEKQDNLCKDLYLESLVELKKVIDTGNSNICSADKIQAIEAYHRRFVTKVSRHKKLRKAIPKIIKLFFMHYATSVGSKCEQSALEVLPEAANLLTREEFNIDETVNSFADALGINEAKLTYDNLFITWNLIENLPLERTDKFSHNIQNGPEKMFIEMKEPQNIIRLQGICNNRLRPLYFNTLLPVMRLVDIGYYPESDLLMKKLCTETIFRSLYLSAQFCETLLPIQVLRNDKLAEGNVVIVPIQEAKKISQRLVAADLEMQKVLESKASLDVDKLESISAEDAKVTATTIKTRVKSRGKVCARALLKLARAIKTKFMSSKRRISISSEDGCIEGVNEAINDAVASMKEEEEDSGDSKRKRRESTLRKVLLLPIKVIGVILYPLIYVLLELPYRWIYKRRLIPVRLMETTNVGNFYWLSYSIHKKDRDNEWKAMMKDRKEKEVNKRE